MSASGNVRTTQIRAGDRQGDGTLVVTAAIGAKTSGNYPQWDSGGKLTNGGTPGGPAGGAAWWGAFTTPVNGDFTWINQGGASVTVNANGIFLSAPANAGTSHRIRKKAAPSTPYTIKVAYAPSMLSLTTQRFGILFRNSSSGAIDTWYALAGYTQIRRDTWTDPTGGGGANQFNIGFVGGQQPLMWLGLSDDGTTNKTYLYSHDGVAWQTLITVARTHIFTPDEVGFFVSEENNQVPAFMTLLSWAQS